MLYSSAEHAKFWFAFEHASLVRFLTLIRYSDECHENWALDILITLVTLDSYFPGEMLSSRLSVPYQVFFYCNTFLFQRGHDTTE